MNLRSGEVEKDEVQERSSGRSKKGEVQEKVKCKKGEVQER